MPPLWGLPVRTAGVIVEATKGSLQGPPGSRRPLSPFQSWEWSQRTIHEVPPVRFSQYSPSGNCDRE